MTETPFEQSGERRLLIDGKLVDSESGKTFENLNPATEEVLGVVADGTRADMEAAVAAARRAFDTTSWTTDGAFRKQCIYQLQAAIESEVEELRAELRDIAAAGVGVTMGERVPEAVAISAPVFGADGRVVAALTISGVASRYEPARVERDSKAVRRYAEAISADLGRDPTEPDARGARHAAAARP